MTTGLQAPEPEFSRKIEVARIGETPMEIDADATPGECAALALRFDVLAVDSLSVRAQAIWDPVRKLIRLTGSVRARVGQACVVSLERVDAEVDAAFERLYTPGAAGLRAKGGEDILADEEDPPEPLLGDWIDVGEVAAEQLLLSLDPYPRKPGAKVPDAYAPGPRDMEEHPFAALRDLKRVN